MPPLDPAVITAADAALAAAFPGCPLRWKQNTSAADTAFSGSAVLELQVDPPDIRVILKHSIVRTAILPLNASESTRMRAERTDRSSCNEVAFLQAYAEGLAERGGCRIPRTLYTSASADGCTLLLESLSTWSQVDIVPAGPATSECLRWLAHFHATFLPSACGGGALPLPRLAELGGWERGQHLELGKRPASELATLPTTMAEFASRFAGSDDYFDSDAAKAQGGRLHAVAGSVARLLGPGPHSTIVQGDYKQGNMFFREAADGGTEIALFDWQWTGPGVGATDLVYVCAMALSDAALVDHERDVLRVYHGHLCDALGGEECYPFEELKSEFKLACLDYQRWQGGSRLSGITPETMSAASENVDVNHGIYRRSLPRMLWIWKTVDAALDDIDAERLSLGGAETSTS